MVRARAASLRIRKIIHDYYKEKLTDEMLQLIRTTRFDLYYGPFGKDQFEFEYPGYITAAKKIQEFMEENINDELWIDMDCDEASNKEPQGYYEDEDTGYFRNPDCQRDGYCECNGGASNPNGPSCWQRDESTWVEPFTENTYHYDVADVRKAILGTELYNAIWR